MDLSIETRNSCCILHLTGDLDSYTAPQMRKEIEKLVAGGTCRVILDLSSVTFIDSSAIRAIISASDRLDAKGGRLAISRPSKPCRHILGVIGLGQVVTSYESEDEAIASLVQNPQDRAGA